MKVEDILKKDRLTEVNPFGFMRLQAALEEREKQYIPKRFAIVAKISLCLIAFAIITNAYELIIFNKSQKTVIAEQKDSYEKFMSENYYDILTKYYPQELFNK
ncbi:MAG: hypothetical protein LBR28_00515 [Bacteroidales bacterium]|jgi:hypothetical protein|nr:hypothetical protein [Bacteroidales bacterium]